VSIPIDDQPPVVTGPFLRFTSGTVGSTVPVRISWTGTDATSGIASYDLIRDTFPGQSTYTLPPSTTVVTHALTAGKKVRYDLAATDKAGNGIPTAFGPTITPTLVQSTGLSFAGTWSTQSSSSFVGGSTRYASKAGSRVTYTFTGRAIALVSTKASSRGKAEVWVDGVKVSTIDLYSSSAKYRQTVWYTSFASVGTHTVKIVVLGTSGRPRVDVDAIAKF
jgi:hypothetical protein